MAELEAGTVESPPYFNLGLLSVPHVSPQHYRSYRQFAVVVVGLVVLRLAPLLLEPVFAHSTGIVVFTPAGHWSDRAIGEQRTGNSNQAEDEEGHTLIIGHSSNGCNVCRICSS